MTEALIVPSEAGPGSGTVSLERLIPSPAIVELPAPKNTIMTVDVESFSWHGNMADFEGEIWCDYYAFEAVPHPAGCMDGGSPLRLGRQLMSLDLDSFTLTAGQRLDVSPDLARIEAATTVAVAPPVPVVQLLPRGYPGSTLTSADLRRAGFHEFNSATNWTNTTAESVKQIQLCPDIATVQSNMVKYVDKREASLDFRDIVAEMPGLGFKVTVMERNLDMGIGTAVFTRSGTSLELRMGGGLVMFEGPCS